MRAVLIGLLFIGFVSSPAWSQAYVLLGVGLDYGVSSVHHAINRTEQSLEFPNASHEVAQSFSGRVSLGIPIATSLRAIVEASYSHFASTQFAQRQVPFIVDGSPITGVIEQQYHVSSQRILVLPGIQYGVTKWLWVQGALGVGFVSAAVDSVRDEILTPPGITFSETGTSTRPAFGTYQTETVDPHVFGEVSVGLSFALTESIELAPYLTAGLALTKAVATTSWYPTTASAGVSLRFSTARKQPVQEVTPLDHVADGLDSVEVTPAFHLLSCAVKLVQKDKDKVDNAYEAQIRIVADSSVETVVTIVADGVVVREVVTDQIIVDLPIGMAAIIDGSLEDHGEVAVAITTRDSFGQVCTPAPSRLVWSRDADGVLQVNQHEN